MKRVTVFGSSRAPEGTPLYSDAYNLGFKLATEGFVVLSGGYGGTMEAVSKGVRLAGGLPVGVTFEAFGNEPNVHVGSQVHEKSLFARLERLIGDADGYVVLNGGMGTLAEFSLAWIHIESGLSSRKPLILVGEGWGDLLQVLLDQFTVNHSDLECLQIVDSVDKAVATLRASFGKSG